MSRFVVCTLGGDEDRWSLPPSTTVTRPFAYGGEQSLYVLAAALAALDHEVELRGVVARAPWERVRDALGAGAVRVDLGARRPDPRDIIVISEGEWDRLRFARLVLSPARLVLHAMAPPGLFGWPFSPGWTKPSPHTADLNALGRAEHLRAAHALGFSLWTNMQEIRRRGEAAGVPVTWIGHGWAMIPPRQEEKRVDVAYLEHNRWASWAREVARELDGLEVDAISEAPHPEVLARLGAARTMIWPSRVEGEPMVTVEARAQGTVPVALGTSPFADALEEEHGVVRVGRREDMARAARALLADPGRWRELSERATRSAREEMCWEPYLERVREAVSSLPSERPGAGAFGDLGTALGRVFEDYKSSRSWRITSPLRAATHLARRRRAGRGTSPHS